MSHRVDTRLAARDPRLNVADAYLFDTAPDRTVMVMACDAVAALSDQAAFHPAALYEFRFDTTATGVAARLIPTVLSYTMGSAATFTTGTIHGRPLEADAFDVMVSLAAGRSLGNGVAPDVSRLLDVFPYYGPPCSTVEQRGWLPMSPRV